LRAAQSARDWPMPEIGKLLVVFGVLITLLGLALWSGFGAGWLGRLPGDIRIERGYSSFYFPIVTCIIISILLSIIMSFFRR
jgi:ABC-type methionine transport system permease subunit